MLVQHIQNQGRSRLLQTLESQEDLAQLVGADNLGGSHLLIDLRLWEKVVGVNASIAHIPECQRRERVVAVLLLWRKGRVPVGNDENSFCVSCLNSLQIFAFLVMNN